MKLSDTQPPPPPLHNLLMPHDRRYLDPSDERACPPNCPYRPSPAFTLAKGYSSGGCDIAPPVWCAPLADSLSRPRTKKAKGK